MPDHAEQVARLQVAIADRYRIERELYRGGIAPVYLAHDLLNDRDVAIKAITAAPEFRDRFLREIHVAQNLNHPHIVPVVETGEVGAVLFAVMPYVEGESLRERLDRGAPLSVEEALAITRDVSAALHYAHCKGLIHRQLSPVHILLAERHAMVTGFGIALAYQQYLTGDQLTTTGSLIGGSSGYMSPEQLKGEERLDGRTDIYALGCVLYEMLAGAPPFGETHLIATQLRRAKATPLPMERRDVPENLDLVIRQALAAMPEERFATALQLLESCINTINALAESDQRPRRWQWPWRRLQKGLSQRTERSPSATALRHRYLVKGELGRGAMAIVYLAEDTKLSRHVALKVLRPEIAATVGHERFLHEIDVTAKLTHPHILPLLDAGTRDGLLYYSMPYIEGDTLRNRLRQDRHLAADEAIQIAAEVADALDYAHSRAVLHRDIKPENILLQERHALVADFGIALALSGRRPSFTPTNHAIGTPEYMSPEQIEGSHDIDSRSDLYALACVVYEMLAGEPPYTGPTWQAVAAKHLGCPVPHVRVVRDTLAEAVDRAVCRGLAKIPTDRFERCSDFAKALASVESQSSGHSTVDA